MVLDISNFRKYQGGNPKIIKESQIRRFKNIEIVDDIVRIDEIWRKKVGLLDLLRKEKRVVAKSLSILFKKSFQELIMKEKNLIEKLKKKSQNISIQIINEEKKLKLSAKIRDKLLTKVGNLVELDIPVNKDDSFNRIEISWGICRKNYGNLKHHHELLWMIGGYEPRRGINIASHRAYFLTGYAVRLNLALQQYGLDFLRKKKYIEVYPPFFMNKEIMAKTSQLEDFNDSLYNISDYDKKKKYLIATSEQPLSAMHMNEWFQKSQLPIRYAGLSTCFRKESGKSGKDCWGIYRVHQFEKIEQFVIAEPKKSWKMFEEMRKIAEEFYQSLNIPYQVVTVVTGELNNAAAKKYDLEGWFPTLGMFKELVSCSNCTDYQSRNMNSRFGQSKDTSNKQFVHMLNSTLTATSRTICSILENYQDGDGIHIPKVLKKYMNGTEFIPFIRSPFIEKKNHSNHFL